jgi:hypothetical protein
MKNKGKTKNLSSEKIPQIKVLIKPFANSKEHQEMSKNLEIGAEFDMRYRGHFLYYGKDLIAYKLEKPFSKKRNDFLRDLSQYMSDHLEDNCPSSWKQCESSFWEEFIFTFYPHILKITPDEKEVETFLHQLKIFVQWIDKRVGTSFYPIIEKFIEESDSELKHCERLLNSIFLIDHPRMYQDDWNPVQDIEKINQKYEKCNDKLNSLFEVTKIMGDTIELTEFNSCRTYNLIGLTSKLFVPGIIMSGVIGKKSSDLVWNWYQTDGVYPRRGKKYITLIS